MKNTLLLSALLVSLASVPVYGRNSLDASSVYWKSFFAGAEEVENSSDFMLRTTMNLRDNVPASKERLVKAPEYFEVVTGSVLFDGLYALAMQEMGENSVEEISDHSFETADCHCFETGLKWNYVWTRDISYSAHLSLGLLDSERTKNSLLFKISKRRDQGASSVEIVQDTGSGGSWPVSTDRIVWALAAEELLLHLNGHERREFLKKAYTAIKNTVERDRIAVYDEKDGLYTGEKSFLDWREQTYPGWTADNTAHIAMSKSLSTNILHFNALRFLSTLALELNYISEFRGYLKMAGNLKKSINEKFWDEENQLYRAYFSTYLDQAPVGKYDLLGNSLAVLMDVAETKEQKTCLKNYPIFPAGPPVIVPQDQEAPIYHNRGIWPFVTAYALKAAKKSNQAALYNHLVESMMRGSALNLSNMENFEFLTMQAWYDDGAYSGPVVNSQRQLWSVAGYLSMVIKDLIGLQIEKDSLKIRPFITEKLRNTVLEDSSQIKLSKLELKGKEISILLSLPTLKSNWNEEAFYQINEMRLNGQRVEGDAISFKELAKTNRIEITLDGARLNRDGLNLFPYDDPSQMNRGSFESVYSPRTPKLDPVETVGGLPRLSFYAPSEKNIRFNIYRDDELLAELVSGGHFIDKNPSLGATHCYAVEAVFLSSGNRSHHSEPQCFWPAGHVMELPIMSFENFGEREEAPTDSSQGRNFLKDWGRKEEVLSRNFSPEKSGNFAMQLVYNNFENIASGITAAVKELEVVNKATGEVQKRVLVMPHHGSNRFWVDSNFARFSLEEGANYTIRIRDFYNMSYFDHFSKYFHRGGRSGPYNLVSISALKILYFGE